MIPRQEAHLKPPKTGVWSKPEYYRLAGRNVFGNKLRTWDGLLAWTQDRCPLPIRFRSKVPGSAVFTSGPPFQTAAAVMAEYERILLLGDKPENIIFCEPAPEEFLTFQGEVYRGPGGLVLAYSTEPGITLREAMTRASSARGLEALQLLQRHLEPEDLEHLAEILDEWDGHVVEFSSYSKHVGVCGRCMVIWEVRGTY